MSVVFTQGQVLGRGDLDIYLSNSSGNPSNAFSISYALYYVDPITTAEVLIGSATRTPVNPSVGEYYASLQVPSSSAPGDYRIRWRFRETATSSEEGAVQEFGIVSNAVETTTDTYSTCVTDLIRKMRFLTRDNCLAAETSITVDANGEKIEVTLAELHEIIGDVSPPPPR